MNNNLRRARAAAILGLALVVIPGVARASIIEFKPPTTTVVPPVPVTPTVDPDPPIVDPTPPNPPTDPVPPGGPGPEDPDPTPTDPTPPGGNPPQEAPEPTTLIMGLTAMGFAGAYRRWKK